MCEKALKHLNDATWTRDKKTGETKSAHTSCKINYKDFPWQRVSHEKPRADSNTSKDEKKSSRVNQWEESKNAKRKGKSFEMKWIECERKPFWPDDGVVSWMDVRVGFDPSASLRVWFFQSPRKGEIKLTTFEDCSKEIRFRKEPCVTTATAAERRKTKRFASRCNEISSCLQKSRRRRFNFFKLIRKSRKNTIDLFWDFSLKAAGVFWRCYRNLSCCLVIRLLQRGWSTSQSPCSQNQFVVTRWWFWVWSVNWICFRF